MNTFGDLVDEQQKKSRASLWAKTTNYSVDAIKNTLSDFMPMVSGESPNTSDQLTLRRLSA